MARTNFYDTVVKYVVMAECVQPLHIGSVSGSTEEVLIHPTNGMPFIQASSIAGVFRSYCEQAYGSAWSDCIFGSRKFEEDSNASEYASKIRFTDGLFSNSQNNKIKLELRPRVSIDDVSGTVASSIESGTKSGQKFNMAYISAGAQFSFSLYLYDAQEKENVEGIFSAIQQGMLQFGGQKSNGCGYFKINQLLCKVFSLRNEADRKLWFFEDDVMSQIQEYEDLTKQIGVNSGRQNAFDVVVQAQTENELLIKSIAVADAGADVQNSENIRNGKGEYIIPGSSLKGAVRSQMEKIAVYLGNKYGWDAETVIQNAFGSRKAAGQGGKSGNLYFLDTIVGDKEENDRMPLSHRIHIDKFTGGVIQGELFSEKNVAGKLELHITIRNSNNKNAEQTCGLLLMALRDLAIGAFTVGSGYSIGKGVIMVKKIVVTEQGNADTCAVIDFSQKKIQDETQIINRCYSALQEV